MFWSITLFFFLFLTSTPSSSPAGCFPDVWFAIPIAPSQRTQEELMIQIPICAFKKLSVWQDKFKYSTNISKGTYLSYESGWLSFLDNPVINIINIWTFHVAFLQRFWFIMMSFKDKLGKEGEKRFDELQIQAFSNCFQFLPCFFHLLHSPCFLFLILSSSLFFLI